MGGVAARAVGVGGGVALGEPEVLAPGRMTEVAAAVAVDQVRVERGATALPAWGPALSQAADRGHGDVGDHHGTDGGPGLHDPRPHTTTTITAIGITITTPALDPRPRRIHYT